MNSKVLFLVLAIVAVGGGFLAIQNLQTEVETDKETVTVDSEEEEEADSTESSENSRSRVSAMDESGNRSGRRSLADRTMRRGAGAASLNVTPATTSTASRAPAVATPPTSADTLEENRSIADLTHMFKSQTDPDSRIDTAEKLGMIDSPESIKSALELLRDEKDPAVQEALIEAMQGLESQDDMADEIFQAVSDLYLKTDNDDVKIAAQDLMGDLATPSAAAGLKQVVAPAAGGDANLVQINAAENLLRISQGEPAIVTPEEKGMISQGLKDQYAKSGDAATRQQILMALATEGRENTEFYQQALENEQDPQNREMLQRLVRMFNSPPPATPPPGTIVTPVPTPFPM